MVFKIKTSQKTQELFEIIEASENLQPYALSKLAISLSLKSQVPLSDEDFKTDNNGLELSRQTIFGDHDLIFKTLIINCENKAMCEEDYFPGAVKAHLDRGAKLLEDEKRYSKDFYNHLCHLDTNI